MSRCIFLLWSLCDHLVLPDWAWAQCERHHKMDFKITGRGDTIPGLMLREGFRCVRIKGIMFIDREAERLLERLLKGGVPSKLQKPSC